MSAWVKVQERLARWKRWPGARWVSDGVFVVVAVVAISAWQTREHLSGEAPDFSLSTLDGGAVSRASVHGRPTVLAFWAPWCSVCKATSPNLSSARSMLGERANVVSVVADYESLADVQAFVSSHGVQYPVALGGDSLARAFHVQAYPTVYFLDADGHVKHSVVGYTTTLGLVLRALF